MAINVSQPMVEKMTAVGDYPIAASDFLYVGEGLPQAERTQGTKGVYISSPVDGWELHGPFDGAV